MTGSHCGCSPPNADMNTRTNAANAAALTPADMNAVTTAGRPLVGVRRPHVERHGRHLERKADQQQAERDIGQQLVAPGELSDITTTTSSSRVVPAMPKVNAMP